MMFFSSRCPVVYAGRRLLAVVEGVRSGLAFLWVWVSISGVLVFVSVGLGRGGRRRDHCISSVAFGFSAGGFGVAPPAAGEEAVQCGGQSGTYYKQ